MDSGFSDEAVKSVQRKFRTKSLCPLSVGLVSEIFPNRRRNHIITSENIENIRKRISHNGNIVNGAVCGSAKAEAAAKIVETVKRTGGVVSGPVPLPTEVQKYTILRAVHINKDSREQFEMRTHKRLIDINNPSKETIDALQHLDLPSGVDIQIKL